MLQSMKIVGNFINGRPHTLHSCAKILGISHTTVAQIEKEALKKLKEILKNKNL